MNRIVTLIVTLLLISPVLKADDTAKSILDKVSENTKKSKSITASFDFIMDNADVGIRESNPGTIIIQGDKYKLSISGIEIYSDGVSMWTYMPDVKEVSISDADSFEDAGINPATIFTIYEQGFKYSYLGEFSRGNKQIHKIDLEPTDAREFSRVILEIDKANYQISEAILYGIDGNRYIVKVLKMETNKEYPSNTFVFNAAQNPGVTVIDMR